MESSWLLHCMGGAVLASFLPAAGYPSSSYHCCPIVGVIASIVISIIDNVIAIVILIIIPAVVTLLLLPLYLSTLLMAASTCWHCHHHHWCCCQCCQHCCCHCYHWYTCPAHWWPIRGTEPNHVTAALPMACGWRAYPWIGCKEPAVSTQGHHVQDATLLEVSWCSSNGGWNKGTLLY